MKIFTSARTLLALLVLPACILPACNKSEEGATEQDSEAQTTAATPGSTGPDGSTSGGGTSPGTTAEPVTTSDGTVDPTTGGPVTSSGPDDTGSTGGGGDSAECVAYCAAIAASCTGVETQYGSPAHCLATCAVLPLGTPADTGGNTVGCRTYHAGAAMTMMDPTTHCVHAGPGGAGACGSNCESFCAIAAAICPEAWADLGSCETACGTFAPDEKYDATDVAGNNFACRLYHLTAATGDPVTHCPHIKGDSAPCM